MELRHPNTIFAYVWSRGDVWIYERIAEKHNVPSSHVGGGTEIKLIQKYIFL